MRNRNKVIKSMSGQTLIEVLTALGLIIVVSTALAGVVMTSMGNARFSKDQNLATQYAQEGMEVMRQIRDDSYVDFRNITTATYCLNDGVAALPLPADCNNANVPGNFLRKVTITQGGCGVNVASVTVTVSWQDSKCPVGNTFCHAARLESCLSTVNPVPTL